MSTATSAHTAVDVQRWSDLLDRLDADADALARALDADDATALASIDLRFAPPADLPPLPASLVDRSRQVLDRQRHLERQIEPRLRSISTALATQSTRAAASPASGRSAARYDARA